VQSTSRHITPPSKKASLPPGLVLQVLVVVIAAGRAAVVSGMLQAGAADVELRLAAGVAAVVGWCTAGRAVEVDYGAAGRAASSRGDSRSIGLGLSKGR